MRILLVLSLTITISLAQDQDGPVMKINDVQGWIKGKLMNTTGNLGREPRTIYGYRNIPYAKSFKRQGLLPPYYYPERFQQSQPPNSKLPGESILRPNSESNPYDASKTGPLCPQVTILSEPVSLITQIPIQPSIELAIRLIFRNVTENPDEIAATLAQEIVDGMNLFFEFEIGPDTTMGELLEDWLDITFSVSEDCLHLAVYTPYDPTTAIAVDSPKLPIMFFVHGGAFQCGTQLFMDASRLGEVADVIVVSINYRVGPLGFLCLDTDEGGGNMGMLDMVLALEWVRDNIAQFGGDKDRITIFGESAGAASIGHLILSNSTTDSDSTSGGLFAQGIGQSGSAVSPWAFDTEPVYNSRAVAERLGCDNDTDHTAIVECMRDKSAVAIMRAFRQHSGDERLRGKIAFGGSTPCAQTAGEKRFYDEFQNPNDLLFNGEYRHIPVFFGANSHEGSFVYQLVHRTWLVPKGYDDDPDYFSGQYMDDFLSIMGVHSANAIAGELEEEYFYDWQLGSQEEMTPGIVDFGGAFMLKASSYQMVEENSKYNDSYFYQIDHPSRKSLFNAIQLLYRAPYVEQDKGLPGVCHGDELMYLFNLPIPILTCNLVDFASAMIGAINECFNTGDPNGRLCFAYPDSKFKQEWGDCIFGELTPEEEILSDRIVRAWTNFAINGTPTPKGDKSDLPYIDAFNLTNPSYLNFGPDGVEAVYDDYINTLPYYKNHNPEEASMSSASLVVNSTMLGMLSAALVIILQSLQG